MLLIYAIIQLLRILTRNIDNILLIKFYLLIEFMICVEILCNMAHIYNDPDINNAEILQ